MARLRAGEREERENEMLRVLQRSRFGIKESEVSEDTRAGS